MWSEFNCVQFSDKEDIIFLQAVQTYSQLLTMNKDWNPLGPFESARK